jgi:hypothetical protein
MEREQTNNVNKIQHMNDLEIHAFWTESPCPRHKPKKLGYLQWHDWAEKKVKRGAKQKQCPKCGRWYFREEF